MYTIKLSDKAEALLGRLDKTVARQIVKKLQWLAQNAETLSHEALKGKRSGAFRLRSGDYRVIYRINHELRVILVEVVGHRRDVYNE